MHRDHGLPSQADENEAKNEHIPPDLLAAPTPRSAFIAELLAVLRFNRIGVPMGRERCWNCGLRGYPRSLSLPIRTSDCPGLLTGAS